MLEKHIILVEDKDEHRFWFHGEFRALEQEYNIKILETDAATFLEVCDFIKLVKSNEKRCDCAIVDMRLPEDQVSDKKVHWGVQALREIEQILALDKVLIVTAHKGEALPFLSEAEKRRVRAKTIHIEVFRSEVAGMLNLNKAT